MIKYLIVMIVFLGCGTATDITESDIMALVAENFIYEKDVNHEWETYEEITPDYTGDCEEAVTLYLGLVYEHTGMKLNGVVIQFDNGKYHAAVRTDLVDYLMTPYHPWIESREHKIIMEYTFDIWMMLTWIM